MKKDFNQIRNVAVIAHVDHGKTTLVDALLKQTHLFRDNQEEMKQERILDSNSLERERGITILAKNCSVFYRETKINIIDTPGHADFSGEVERTLSMADGALLIVDAQEGPMPQTRFVLKKALSLGLKIIVVINKIDKKLARVEVVKEKIENLFLELAVNDEQLEFPILYAVGRQGKVFKNLTFPEKEGDILPLLETIIDFIPKPKAETDKPFKMLVSSLDYNPHQGRILIGKIHQGKLAVGDQVMAVPGENKLHKVESLMVNHGLEREEVKTAFAGEIVALTGIDQARIGQTLATKNDQTPLPSQKIGQPTLHLTIGPNTSPFAGREGKFITSRQLEDRLYRELETNLSLKLEKLNNGKFKLSGRGELHLAILLETMRREGYEMEVGKPEVILKKDENGQWLEPWEELSLIVTNEYQGTITQELGQRAAKLIKMEPISDQEIEFLYQLPTRSLLGLRSLLLTKTKGTILFSSQVLDYRELGKELPKLRSGVLIAATTGQVLAYGLHAAQQRGLTFVSPGEEVYEGMIIGKNAKEQDIEINVCKGKKLTNMRSKSSDGIIQLAPPVQLSLEQSLDFLEDDELLEITPKSLRLRKKLLTEIERRRARRKVHRS